MNSKYGLCTDAAGAPGMAAPQLSELVAVLSDTETDVSDCLCAIGRIWGQRVVEHFAHLLALRTGLLTTLAQSPAEPFLELCRDYLGEHGFGSCTFVEGPPTLTVRVHNTPPGADALLSGFFEALVAGVMAAPVTCQMTSHSAGQVVLRLFQSPQS